MGSCISPFAQVLAHALDEAFALPSRHVLRVRTTSLTRLLVMPTLRAELPLAMVLSALDELHTRYQILDDKLQK